MLIFHLWFIVFINVLHCQRPSLYQEYGSLTLSFKDPQGDVDIGSTIFNNMFWSSASHIIYRYCPTCQDTHKHIYYKRLTDLDTFDLYSNIYIWTDSNNILHDDFDLYSTANDVLDDINRWNACDYNDDRGVGFPRNCGPNSYVGCNFVSRDAYYDQFHSGCSREAYFYIYRGTVRKFTYFSTSVDRTTAEANCANLGQTLATVKNDHDIQAVANLGAISTNFWIGLYEPSQTNNEWAWDDGSQCENELGPSIFISTGMRAYVSAYCFNYWPGGEPNGGSEQCAYMSITAAGTLWKYWSSNDCGCHGSAGYVCSESTIPNPAVSPTFDECDLDINSYLDKYYCLETNAHSNSAQIVSEESDINIDNQYIVLSKKIDEIQQDNSDMKQMMKIIMMLLILFCIVSTVIVVIICVVNKNNFKKGNNYGNKTYGKVDVNLDCVKNDDIENDFTKSELTSNRL